MATDGSIVEIEEQVAHEDARRPFDLAAGPLLRSLLVRVADDDHRLYLTIHHIVLDGVSIYRVLLPELAALYEAFAAGAPSPLAPLPVQYADFADWQRERVTPAAIKDSIAWWRRRLAGAPALVLPTDHARPAVQSFAGARHKVALPRWLSGELRALARREGTSLFMTLLACFEVLLHRYTGQDDLVLGTVSAGRSRPEIEGLLGFFANPVALRADVSGDPPFNELLTRVRSEGSFTGRGFDFCRSATGCYRLESQRLRLTELQMLVGSDLFIGRGATQDDPRLIDLRDRVKSLGGSFKDATIRGYVPATK